MTPSEETVLRERVAWLEKLFDERDRRYEERFTAMDEKTTLALTASDKAVNKAEVAMEKRFDNTNEWRQAMQDRDRNQMPRIEIEQRFSSITSGLRWAAGITLTLILSLLALYFKGR